MANKRRKRLMMTRGVAVGVVSGDLKYVTVVSVHHRRIKLGPVTKALYIVPHRRVMVTVAREQHVLRRGRDLRVGVVRNIDALEGGGVLVQSKVWVHVVDRRTRGVGVTVHVGRAEDRGQFTLAQLGEWATDRTRVVPIEPDLHKRAAVDTDHRVTTDICQGRQVLADAQEVPRR